VRNYLKTRHSCDNNLNSSPARLTEEVLRCPGRDLNLRQIPTAIETVVLGLQPSAWSRELRFLVNINNLDLSRIS